MNRDPNYQPNGRTFAHEINQGLLEVIKRRQRNRFALSLSMVAVQMTILLLMMVGVFKGLDIKESWKEVLLVLLGGFVASFSKLVDFYYNNAQDDNRLIDSAQDYRTGVNGNGQQR